MLNHKKKNDKNKHEPKEQRKGRPSRTQAGKTTEQIEETNTKAVPKVFQKPVYEEPGPEFFMNLKRETGEIVKITEAENAKYRKKEIQSNWAKYEMPLESYEDVDEQDVGADYEKLIQAPMIAGGHFQFKHEKSWEASTVPSLYNKYFEIDMDNLSTAISTMPFYERNDIERSEFSETELLSMNTRASKYKLKYYNDKTFSTTETNAQEKILKSVRESRETNDATQKEKADVVAEIDEKSDKYEVNLEFNDKNASPIQSDKFNNYTKCNTKSKNSVAEFNYVPDNRKCTSAADKFTLLKDVAPIVPTFNEETQVSITNVVSEDATVTELLNAVTKETIMDSKDDAVIKSPEELEKWLDDMLEI